MSVSPLTIHSNLQKRSGRSRVLLRPEFNTLLPFKTLLPSESLVRFEALPQPKADFQGDESQDQGFGACCCCCILSII
jgi:hypothetical protein